MRWCFSPPEAVRFYSPCLAFSPGKGSVTVIETPLPEALYTQTHNHRHTQALALLTLCLPGLRMCHLGFISVTVFLFLHV